MDGAGVDETTPNQFCCCPAEVTPHRRTHHRFRATPPHVPSAETRLESGTRGPQRNRRGRMPGRRSSKESDGDARGPWARTERRPPTPRPPPACHPRHPVGELGTPWQARHPFRSGGSTAPWRTGGRPPHQGLGRRSAAASLSAWRNDNRISVIVKIQPCPTCGVRIAILDRFEALNSNSHVLPSPANPEIAGSGFSVSIST